jgi:hypothetical protein
LNVSRRSFFTFLELLVVMALLITITGVVAVSVNSLVKEQRFKSGIQAINEKLLFAQQLMIIQKSDIQLRFHRDPKKKDVLIVDVNSSKALSKITLQLLSKTREIQGIASFAFIDANGKQIQGPFFIDFNSSSHKLTRGTLIFSAEARLEEESSLKTTLFLPGYITPLSQELTQLPPIPNAFPFFPKEVMEAWSTQKKKQNEGEKK